MIKMKIFDRRVNRTPKSLQEALVRLILDKWYDEITVQDVIECATVGRFTFYAHLQDIDDLLISQFDEVRQQFNRY